MTLEQEPQKDPAMELIERVVTDIWERSPRNLLEIVAGAQTNKELIQGIYELLGSLMQPDSNTTSES